MGDKVLAYNSETGKDDYETVDAVLVHTDPVTEDLTISSEVVHTTPEHPFYTLDRGWVAAGDLKPGEMVEGADGRYGVVQSIVKHNHPQVMYNLTVHGDHTFFAGVGEWLVHNSNPNCDDMAEKLKEIFSHYTVGGSHCEVCAAQVFNAFQEAGYEPQYGRIIANTVMLGLKDGTFLAVADDYSPAFHDFVVVEGRVYDVITGPQGMAIDDYFKLFYPDHYNGASVWNVSYFSSPQPVPSSK